MLNQSFRGLVFFSKKHREHDGLVKILTDDFGSKMFFVRRLYQPNHPMLSQLTAYSYNQYMGQINKEGLSFLNEAQTLDYFKNIQEDDLLQAYATYFLQLANVAMEGSDQEGKGIFNFLLEAMQALDDLKMPELVRAYLEVKLLPFFGIAINWQDCLFCSEYQDPMDFSVQGQGLLCPSHYDRDPRRLHLNPRTMYIVRLLSAIQFDQIDKVKLSQERLSDLDYFLSLLYKEYVGLSLKSKHYLDQVQGQTEALIKLLQQRRKK